MPNELAPLPPPNVAIWAALIKILFAVGYIMLAVPMIVWLERKVIADFQARIGPNRVGPFGLLQSFADGIKLVAKESIMPRDVDPLLYLAAPVVVMIPALVVAAVIPFAGDWEVGGYLHRMVIADIPVGVLFVLALTSLSVYGIVLSGWSSNNKYSLLGGLRSSAQMVSYELPMGFSIVAGVMIASWASESNLMSLSIRQIVDAQYGGLHNWSAFNPRFLFLGLPAFLIFYICGIAETNRAPFDLPEAESELIGGYHTEYGGLKWAMFFLGEYAAMLNVSAMATSIFLGGWHAPYRDNLFIPYGSPLYMLQGLFWFGLKVYAIILVYIWLRATLPRLRYDQLMDFSWKRLLPLSLANLLLVASILTFMFPQAAPAVLLQQAQPSATSGTEGTPPAMTPGGANPAVPGGLPPGILTPGQPPGGMGRAGGGFPRGTATAPGTMPGGRAPAPGSTPSGGGH
jgi:NADH-quinone oxidoreductase subunit H